MKEEINGLLVLDKPGGMTSREVCDRAMRWFPRRTRIGHTGTLDPLATGVLVLCLGRATRLAEFVQRMDKTYETMIILGARSDTDDRDGTIVHTLDAKPVELESLQHFLATSVGEIMQTPPDYSAVKVDGKRAHAIARKGRELRIEPRNVQIHGIEIKAYAWPQLELAVRCGKGTYIRSLARDLGETLGVGAYVSQLRRTHVGPFEAGQTLNLDASKEEARERLRPVDDAVSQLPKVHFGEVEVNILRHGQGVPAPAVLIATGSKLCAMYGIDNALVGVGTVGDDGQVRPVKILYGI